MGIPYLNMVYLGCKAYMGDSLSCLDNEAKPIKWLAILFKAKMIN